MNFPFLRIAALLLFGIALHPAPLAAQNEMTNLKIRCSYEDQPLDVVFLDLKINHQLKFEYGEIEIENIRISQAFGKLPLEEALSFLLQGTGLRFELEPPNVVRIFEYDPTEDFALNPSTDVPERENFTAKGTVRDKNTGETLPFATVVVRGTNNGASTNVDGYFTVFNVPSDTAVLEIIYLGYHTTYFRLRPDMEMEELTIEMEDMSQELAQVLVTATEEEQLLKASTGISKMAITPIAMATLPSFGEKDIFRSLQLLPGVSGSNEASSGLYVRGGTPDQNLVLFDGFTVYHVDHLFGFFSAFNTNAIKDVQLHKGGFEAKFGGRLSSVVELTGKDGNTEQLNVGLGLSLLSVNGFLESPFADGKGSFLVAGRRSFQSSFYSNIFDAFTQANSEIPEGPGGGRFGRQQVQPNTYFYDINAKVTYRPSDKDMLSLSFFNGQDDLDNSRNTDNSAFNRPGGGDLDFNFQQNSIDLTKWGNWGSSAKWSRRWSDRFYSNANLSFSNYYSERDRSNETTVTREDSTFTTGNGTFEKNDLKDYAFKLDNEWKLGQHNQLEFGLQNTYNDIRYEYTQNDTLSILNRVNTGWTNSVYLQDRHVFGEKLIAKAGVRASHYSLTNQLYYEPRASVTYLLSDQIKLKGAWGKYYQFATRVVREDIQQGSRDFWILADDGTVPIGEAIHYIAGVAYETPKYLFDVEAYFKDLDGLTEYSTRFVPSGFGPDRTLDYEEFFYTGTGQAKGLEFLVQKKSGALTGWVGYTLGQVKYDFDAFGDEPFFANQDQTHELKIVGNYKLKENFTLGATFIYATGRPYTAPTGYYELTLLDGSTAAFFEVSDKNALRLPDYHRFDISATWDFRLGRSKANIGMSIFNVYNRKNVWYKEYEVVEGEVLETDVNLLDFTPSLFFNWTLR
ncbi:MAG: TonB-dependent receptor [Phaeodactylibacter sp.]|nr:TonB-dependent receptor [Phaeodactylibacter sp.]